MPLRRAACAAFPPAPLSLAVGHSFLPSEQNQALLQLHLEIKMTNGQNQNQPKKYNQQSGTPNIQSQNPYAPPRALIADINAVPVEAAIEDLPVSEKWKARFRAIALAGGPKMPNFKKLSKSDRRKAYSFNFLAFLFGPLYYIAKGMWKRGIALFALLVVVVIVLGFALDFFGFERVSNALGYGVSAVFAIRANIDFYKKMVLGDNGWW